MADEKEAPVEVAAPQKKSKIMLFVLLGVAIVVLAGGGFFAYSKFMAPKPVAETTQAQNEKDIPEGMGSIYQLSAFTVNLSDPKGKRYLKLKIEIELENELAVELATKADPKLRDMVIMLLTSLTFEDVMTPEGKIRIRDELLDRFNRIMKPEKVKNIYFTDFVVQ